jgi:hypothetical protein
MKLTVSVSDGLVLNSWIAPYLDSSLPTSLVARSRQVCIYWVVEALLILSVAMRVRTDYIYSRKCDSTLGTSSVPEAPPVSLASLATPRRPTIDALHALPG